MNIFLATFMVIAIIPAASYGWGMRGTTIGGEKGAMLPGALIGTVLALFSGIFIVQEHFYIFSALGAVAMYFGGSMTYGETLAFSMSAHPAENMKKGLWALFLKGSLWFGSFGSIFATGVNAVCKKYNWIELLIIYIATPLVAIALYYAFNKPMSVADNKYPRFYFSKTRQESWGAIFGIVVVLMAMAVFKGDRFSIIFPLSCALFGGLGWVLGQLMQIFSKHYAPESESYFFRLFSEARGAEPWKEMECIFGAMGGLGAAIGFILTFDTFKSTVFTLELNGGLKSYNGDIVFWSFVVWLVLLGLDMVHYFVKRPFTKDELKKLLQAGKITKEFYGAKLIKAKDSVPAFYDIYEKATDIAEFLLYGAFPFILICSGSTKSAVTTSFFLVFWVIVQEVAFEKKLNKVFSLILKIILSTTGALILIASLGFDYSFTYKTTLIMYTLVYEVLTFVWVIPSTKERLTAKLVINEKTDLLEKRSLFTTIIRTPTFLVHGYFIICIMILLFMTIR